MDELHKIISVRNFRICCPLKISLFEILEALQKLLLAIILGVLIFRVFEILEDLPYMWKLYYVSPYFSIVWFKFCGPL